MQIFLDAFFPPTYLGILVAWRVLQEHTRIHSKVHGKGSRRKIYFGTKNTLKSMRLELAFCVNKVPQVLSSSAEKALLAFAPRCGLGLVVGPLPLPGPGPLHLLVGDAVFHADSPSGGCRVTLLSRGWDLGIPHLLTHGDSLVARMTR